MSRFKRWTVGVFSQLDNAVSKIENHDGLVSVSIRDAQSARARARVQLQRVHRDGNKLTQQIAALTRDESQWRDRARKVGADDEARAIDCLARGRRAHAQREDLESQLREHADAESKLNREVAAIEQRHARRERMARIRVPERVRAALH